MVRLDMKRALFMALGILVFMRDFYDCIGEVYMSRFLGLVGSVFYDTCDCYTMAMIYEQQYY
jgi:hypothetical protein